MSLTEEEKSEEQCNFDLHRFRVLLELYKEFAKKECIHDENGFVNVFELANEHVLKWFNGQTGQRDPKAFESYLSKRLNGRLNAEILLPIRGEGTKSTQATSGNEGRNVVGMDENSRGKRPMEEIKEYKIYKKNKAFSESGGEIRLNPGEERKADMDKGKKYIFENGGEIMLKKEDATNLFALELNSKEALKVLNLIVDIVKKFCLDMKDGRENPMNLMHKDKHFHNYEKFVRASGSPKVDELMHKIENRLTKDDIGLNKNERRFDLYLFWSMLLIGQEICAVFKEKGIEIDIWGRLKILEAINSIEKWANNEKLPNLAKESIQITINH